jgi:hypothetical protein
MQKLTDHLEFAGNSKPGGFETVKFHLFNSQKDPTNCVVLLSITYCAGEGMAVKSVQFTVATHIAAALGITSTTRKSPRRPWPMDELVALAHH